METKIIKIGSSKGIVISHTILQEIGAKEGDKLQVSLTNNVISLKKLSSPPLRGLRRKYTR